MIQYIIPIVKCWLPIWNEYLVYVFALGFVAFCGCMLHSLFRR